MPAPYDFEDSRLRVGLTANGQFYNIGKVTDWTVDSQADDPVTREWLGGQDTKPPKRVAKSGTFETFLDTGDTNGQVIVQTAHDDRTPVFLQSCLEGTEVGDTVYQVQAYITTSSWRGGGFGGEGIKGNIGWRGLDGTWTEVTLAA